MTRQQVITIFEREVYGCETYGIKQDSEYVQARLYVIKELKNNAILIEKIKSEINKLNVYYTTNTDKDLISLNAVNRIIEKHISGKESK